jgi:RimJ/RimL family protein N-acetyltransferase
MVVGVASLESSRLMLEPWDERHRGSWRSICGDPEVLRFIGPGEVWEVERADEVFDRALQHWQEHGFGWRSVLVRDSGDWLGFVALNCVGPGTLGIASDAVEIGWWIVRAAWGRGYASEGAIAIRDEGFERVQLDALIARIQPANAASARVAEKIGMRFEQGTTGRSGEAVDIYALGRMDWRRLQTE